MPDATLTETVEVPTSVLVETAAQMLALEKRMLAFNGEETLASCKVQELAHDLLDLLDAAGAHVNTAPTDEELQASFRHPAIVEAYAREQELLGHQDAADRVRSVGDARANWDDWGEEQAGEAS